MTKDDEAFKNLNRTWQNTRYLIKHIKALYDEGFQYLEKEENEKAEESFLLARRNKDNLERTMNHAKKVFRQVLTSIFQPETTLVIHYRETEEGIFAKVGCKEYQPIEEDK